MEIKTERKKKRKIKFVLFKTLYHALDSKQLSAMFSIIMLIIYFFQLIAMTFNSYNKHLKNSLISNFLPIMDYILIFPSFQKTVSPVFNLSFIFVSAFILGYLTFGFFYIKNFKNQDDVFIREFKNSWSFLFDSIDKIFFHPIFGLIIVDIRSIGGNPYPYLSSKSFFIKILFPILFFKPRKFLFTF